MQKRFFPFSILSRVYTNALSTSALYRKSAINKAIANMADSDPAEPSDLVNMSEELNLEDKVPRQDGKGGRGKDRSHRGRGGRGGGGGCSRGGEMNRDLAVSKALSKLLRHAAEEAGLALDAEGFARLDQVVSFPIFAAQMLSLLLHEQKRRWHTLLQYHVY